MENSNTAWGALMIAYLVPWAIWAARNQDAPGKPYDKRTAIAGLCGTSGMLLLMLGWWMQLNPLGAVVLLLGPAAALGCFAWLLKRIVPRQPLRYLLAGSAVWVLGVGAWWLIFRQHTELDGGEVAMLAALPPAVAAFALSAGYWART